MIDVPVTFAFQLKPVLEKLGMSQRKLAKLLRCEVKEVSRYANGHACPSWQRVIAIAVALGVSCGVFFDGDSAHAEFFQLTAGKKTSRRKAVPNAPQA